MIVMSNLSDILNGRSVQQARDKRMVAPRTQMIHYTQLVESEKNFYETDGILELADSILASGQIFQNLVVRKIDVGKYEVIAGHRRRLAAIANVKRGYKEFEFLPCIVQDMDDVVSEVNLILTNSTQRIRTDYEKMQEIQRLKELLPLMENEPVKGRALREMIANVLGVSKTKVAQLENINNNLVPEAMEKFKKGKINVSVANEMAAVPEEKQRELIKKNNLSLNDVKQIKKETKSKVVSESDTGKQQEKCVSESDTRKDDVQQPILPPSNHILLDSYSGDKFKRIQSGMQRCLIIAKSSKYDHWQQGDIVEIEWCETQEVVKVMITYIEKYNRCIADWAMAVHFKVVDLVGELITKNVHIVEQI